MSEEGFSQESAPKIDPYQVIEALIDTGVWTPETEATLDALLVSHEEELSDIYRLYVESGVELPEYEQRLFKWLEDKFKESFQP